jgi:ribonucleoside-diphosphate reductase alpha chain
VPDDLHIAARQSWQEALVLGRRHGYRNAQVTVIAPTGTIAFMMDCDTTGIEPDLSLVKYKQLVGGGMLKIVNRTVAGALRNRGYSDEQIEDILAYIDENDTIESAPHLRDEDLPVFDCAFGAGHGGRSIHYMGHIRMMAAAQAFLSGGISKTINLPAECTIEDIEESYVAGWKLGLKSLAVYRDGSKRTQPLNTRSGESGESGESDEAITRAAEPVSAVADGEPRRHKLPDVRQARTHKFSIAGHEGYLTVGLYEDGQPGELFLRMNKEGSTISGLMDTIATMTSYTLQYGVPLKFLVDKFSHSRFEPSGFTQNPDIPIAKSVTDYVFRWLGLNFLSGEALSADPQDSVDLAPSSPSPSPSGDGSSSGDRVVPIRGGSRDDRVRASYQEDAPPCITCGSIMFRAGACYLCPTCGDSGGCG